MVLGEPWLAGYGRVFTLYPTDTPQQSPLGKLWDGEVLFYVSSSVRPVIYHQIHIVVPYQECTHSSTQIASHQESSKYPGYMKP
jgi:hypothetical protein